MRAMTRSIQRARQPSGVWEFGQIMVTFGSSTKKKLAAKISICRPKVDMLIYLLIITKRCVNYWFYLHV